jgi:hypothetical protein
MAAAAAETCICTYQGLIKRGIVAVEQIGARGCDGRFFSPRLVPDEQSKVIWGGDSRPTNVEWRGKVGGEKEEGGEWREKVQYGPGPGQDRTGQGPLG